jgi:hypothetical protein
MLSSMFGLTALSGATESIDMVSLDLVPALSMIAILGGIVMLSPNSQQILRSHWISCDEEDAAAPVSSAIRWQPTAVWAFVAAVMMVLAFTSLGENGNFLYYQF